MAQLDISLFGSFEVMLNGLPLTQFRTDKMRALLAYLAVEADHTHRRDMLVGLLWPDVPEVAAQHNLSQALLLLRHLLGDKPATPATSSARLFLLASRQTIRFNPASTYTLDVAAFHAEVRVGANTPSADLSPAQAHTLTRAVARYRGEFLHDITPMPGAAFEEWTLLKRADCHLLAVDALDALAHYHARRSEFVPAAAYARQRVALDPLREAAHRQLMVVLALAGRCPEALAQYTACQALLAQELGIDPAPETTALYEQIRTAQLECLTLDDTVDAPALRQAPLVITPWATPSTCVGRADELARLDEALSLTLRSQGQVRFVTGTIGSGKTTILAAFAQHAVATRADILVVNGSGNAYTGPGDPYWPFIEILRQLQGATPISSTLSPVQTPRLELAHPVLMPLLDTHGPDLARLLARSGSGAGSPGLEQTSLFAQITHTLQTVAAHYPLVVLLDDVQWVDRDSLNLLFHLGRHLAGQRICIVWAVRAERLAADAPLQGWLPDLDQPHPLVTLVTELQRHLGDIRIDLAQAEGRAFVDALLDSEPNHLGAAFRATLVQQTGGHALFTTELLWALRERGDLVRDAHGAWVTGTTHAEEGRPARVEAVIAARLHQLPTDWQALLRIASIEGDEFTAQVVAHVLDLPEATVSRQLSGALTRQHALVVPLGAQMVGGQMLARYRFRHLLFQQYLYDQLDPVEQAQGHALVGNMLETLYGERATDISLALARHFELGGDVAKAGAYLLHAARRATHLGATEEALRLLTHGLALIERREPSPARTRQEAELQLTLGNALLAKGWSLPARAQAITRASALCRRTGDANQVARSLLLLANLNLANGAFAQVERIGAELNALARATPDPLPASLARYALGAVAFLRGNLREAHQHLEQAIALHVPHLSNLPSVTGADIAVGSRVWLVNTLWMLGYAEQAVMHSTQAIAAARDLNHAFSLGFALSVGELNMRQHRREPQMMREVLPDLVRVSTTANLDFFRPWIMGYQGWLAAVDDHDPAGLAQIQQALRLWDAAGTQMGRVYLTTLLIEAQLALQQIEPALATVEQTITYIAATDHRPYEAEVLRLGGEALRQLQRPAEAADWFQRAITVAQAQGAKTWELRTTLSLCQLRQSTGPPDAYAAGRRQLADLLAWFSEAQHTPDLCAAAGFLAEQCP